MSTLNELVIAPIADIAGVLAATTIAGTPPTPGFNCAVPLYTIAHPIPRTQTHGWTGTAFTSDQEDAVEDPGTGARAMFPNTEFLQYNRVTQRGVPNARLLARGLTTSPT